MPVKDYPSIDYVCQCLREENGHLFWLRRPLAHFSGERSRGTWNTRFSGTEAGTIKEGRLEPGKPRCHVNFGGRNLLRYTIVWAIHKREWRAGLDHENRDQLDDRIENLRPADQTLNNANSSRRKDNLSGYKGVSWTASRGRNKWLSQIKFRGRHIHLGYFDDPVEAAAAYVRAAQKYFGDYHFGG